LRMEGVDTFNASLLCGDTPFWNEDLTWNTEVPSLTRCFRRTMFTMAPGALFWFLLPFHVHHIRKKPLASKVQFCAVSVAKILLAGFLVLVSILDLSYWSLNSDMIVLDAVEAAFRVLTFAAIVFVIKVSNIVNVDNRRSVE
jgi:hypothetical protein